MFSFFFSLFCLFIYFLLLLLHFLVDFFRWEEGRGDDSKSAQRKEEGWVGWRKGKGNRIFNRGRKECLLSAAAAAPVAIGIPFEFPSSRMHSYIPGGFALFPFCLFRQLHNFTFLSLVHWPANTVGENAKIFISLLFFHFTPLYSQEDFLNSKFVHRECMHISRKLWLTKRYVRLADYWKILLRKEFTQEAETWFENFIEGIKM